MARMSRYLSISAELLGLGAKRQLLRGFSLHEKLQDTNSYNKM